MQFSIHAPGTSILDIACSQKRHIKPETLLPAQHSLHVYLQIQERMLLQSWPQELIVMNQFKNQAPWLEPEEFLQFTGCNCKADCNNQRCNCKKNVFWHVETAKALHARMLGLSICIAKHYFWMWPFLSLMLQNDVVVLHMHLSHYW